MGYKQAEELRTEMHIRARLIESARESLRRSDDYGALRDVLAVLEHIQARDESLVQLHAECHSLIDHARKVLDVEMQRRPLPTIIVKGDGCG